MTPSIFYEVYHDPERTKLRCRFWLKQQGWAYDRVTHGDNDDWQYELRHVYLRIVVLNGGDSYVRSFRIPPNRKLHEVEAPLAKYAHEPTPERLAALKDVLATLPT